MTSSNALYLDQAKILLLDNVLKLMIILTIIWKILQQLSTDNVKCVQVFIFISQEYRMTDHITGI